MSKVDPSTLGWVKGEIDETLRQARLALEAFVENPADTGALRYCVTYLHQVAGTLQMVELDGPAALAREIEALASAMVDGKVAPNSAVLDQFSRAILSLPEYLNRLQFGQPDVPLRLLPLMNELRAARAAEPLSELELFAPDLSIRPPNRGAKHALSEAEFSAIVKKLRPAFQTALLTWLRDADAKGPLEKMAEIAAELEREANVGAIEQLGWVAGGYLAALIEGSMEPTSENKKLLGRLDQQIKKLLDGTEKNLVRSSSQALTKAMLFELGQIRSTHEKVAHIKRAFDLDVLLSLDGGEAEAQEAPTPEALQSVAGVIGQEIEKAQELLTAYFDPVRQDPNALVALTALTQKMSAALDLLKVGPLKTLVDELTETCRAITDGRLGASEATSIELAGALLQVEQGARGIHTPDAGWKQKLEDRIAALRALRAAEGEGVALVEGIEISDAALTESEFKQLLSVVAGEVRVNLKKVEEDLEAFAARPQEPGRIQNVSQYLNQIQGALQILGQERASELTAITNQYIQDIQGQLLTPNRTLFDALAVAIGTIEAYLDGLERDRPNLQELIETALRQLDVAVGAGADNPMTHIAAMHKDLEFWLEDKRRSDALNSAIARLETITAVAHRQSQDKIVKIGSDLGSLLQIVKQDPGQVTEEIVDTVKKSFETLASLCRRQLGAASPGPKLVNLDASSTLMGEEIVMEGPISAPPPAPSKQPEATTKAAAKKPEILDPEILEIFIEDAREILKLIDKALPAWAADTTNRDYLLELRRAFHTLKGSGRMVGAVDIGELGFAVEGLLNRVRDNKVSVSDALLDLLEEVRQALPALIAELEGGPPAGVDVTVLQLRANELANNSAPSARASTKAPSAAAPAQELPVIDTTLLQIFTTEVRGHLAVIEEAITASKDGEVQVSAALLRASHTLQGSARALGLEFMADTCAEMERLLQAMEAGHVPISKSTIKMFGELDAAITQLLSALNGGIALSEKGRNAFSQLAQRFQEEGGLVSHDIKRPPEFPQLIDEIELQPIPENGPVAPPRQAIVQTPSLEPEGHEIDPELLDVFQEEASDILDAIEEALTKWRKDRSDATAIRRFKRELHTLKGGARMAGAAVMGNISHNTESLLRKVEDGQIAPDNDLFDLLDEVHDMLIVMLERIQSRRPEPPEAEALNRKLLVRLGTPPDPERPVAGQRMVPDEDAPEDGEVPGFERREQIKVQTRLLNNLVNYAGEVSIARSRMEQQIFGFREHLSELNRNVTRFREQIRELEIQSESQILYRAEQEQRALAASDFDPLEFDRYSKLQYLSRSLAESLHDLSTIQNTMSNFASEAETALQQQARVNTELQEGLMRTRMVSFATQAPRLRHIVRQTARELGKRAELYLTGTEVEVDRNVLERMIGPFEHMIRNAIDHGIESEEQRRRAQKSVTGKITIHTSHEGSEVVVRFSDDGAGLDLEAIRKQAVARELIKPDIDLSDEEIMQFILLPGFSTARKITHLSGRGVGMDVVHNEVKQLGGTIMVETKRGMGTSFVVRLPLTLSITQALMAYVGDQVFAVPLASIVNILEVPVEKLSAISKGDKSLFHHEEQVYPFMHLATRLNISVPARSLKKVPVLLVRSGTRQIAIQVDALGGTREVVIKPLGLQLSEIKGLAGATILGDGRVVLILDIGGLWIGDDSMRLVRAYKEEQEAAGERPLIMVVDDSLTVRKITSRHLQKQGMDVLVAKDGLDALEQLRQQTPDVMLVDIEMPRMDGYELTANVRSDPHLKHIPIIMITSRAGAKHRERAMQLGADVYMSKPYQEDDLLHNIENMLTRGRLH